jgi:hypothetical protein
LHEVQFWKISRWKYMQRLDGFKYYVLSEQLRITNTNAIRNSLCSE